MMFEPLTLIALLIAVAALMLCLWQGRRIAALGARLQRAEQRVNQVGETFQGLSAGARGQGEHLARVESDMARLRERMEQLATEGGGGGAAFNQAIRMARRGTSAAEIMETCGLSQVEADLVVLLHKELQD
ncbi:DUF2802 domain-containing protein [Alkalilimnicola sp. S0819]|uniref:DUF2802 domain-containing protein n=1 Tax=Alkalilimnicola sp. S0819 TaxID=2613922 RepID=UPI00126198D8|nr:DUF2802 domain-containing protein [Alkalilimnicola sp. S0819]KAB7627156.1 DUF2802 domain-containing protein [Alkalilimnicola sp. S0819]MPQ15865.1 DUF2802 domain-containing protein [Alkalilimnicola sp. S0819]